MGRSRVDAAVEELLSRVVSGTYPAGTALPGEAALASDLSVSRLTAREATRILVTGEEGLELVLAHRLDLGLGDVWARERKESHGWEPTRAPRLRLPMSVDDGTG